MDVPRPSPRTKLDTPRRRAPTTSRRRSSFSGASGSLSTSPLPSPRCLPPRAARGRDFLSFVPCDMSRHCSGASGWLICAWLTELSCAAGPQGHVHRLKASKNKALVWSVFCLALPCAVLLFAGETEFNCAFKVSHAPPPLQVARHAWGWVRIAQFSKREQHADSAVLGARAAGVCRLLTAFPRTAGQLRPRDLLPDRGPLGQQLPLPLRANRRSVHPPSPRPRPALAMPPLRRRTERGVPAGRYRLGCAARLDQLPAALQGSRRKRPSPRHPRPPGPASAPQPLSSFPRPPPRARARTRRFAAALPPRCRCGRCLRWRGSAPLI